MNESITYEKSINLYGTIFLRRRVKNLDTEHSVIHESLSHVSDNKGSTFNPLSGLKSYNEISKEEYEGLSNERV